MQGVQGFEKPELYGSLGVGPTGTRYKFLSERIGNLGTELIQDCRKAIIPFGSSWKNRRKQRNIQRWFFKYRFHKSEL